MLTELDNCILGVIWREGPMSAYDIRSHFAASTTVAWSSSTGTIYPATKRLLAAKLIEAGPRSGPRGRQLLALTVEGNQALHQWLENVGPELGSSTADPLRTRVHFLGALASLQRKRALDDYREVTCEQIQVLELALDKPARTPVERSERLGTLGALMELKARLAWLEAIEAEVAGVASPK